MTVAEVPESAVQAVRSAENGVERAAWDVHCNEVVVARCIAELASANTRVRRAREKLTVAKRVHVAVLAQFPEVEAMEVDLHGIE